MLLSASMRVLVFFIINLAGFFASAQAPIEPDVVQAEADQVRVVQNSIRLASGVSYELTPIENHLLENPDFDEQAKESQDQFLQKREKFLTALAQFFQKTELALGFGGMIKRKILFWKQSNGVPKSMRAYGHQAVQTIIQELDRELWKSHLIVSSQREIHAHLSPSAWAGAGVRSRGLFLGLGLTASFGYNFEKEALVVEALVFKNTYDKALPFVVGGGVTFAIGLRFLEESLLFGKGQQLILPGFLGFTRTSKELTAQLELSLAAAFVSLQSKYSFLRLFRFSIPTGNIWERSPVLRAFVRIQNWFQDLGILTSKGVLSCRRAYL